MRILVVTQYYPPEGGSGARLVGELTRYLADAGEQVTVLCPQPTYHVAQSDTGPQPVRPGERPDLAVLRYGGRLPPFLPHRSRRALEHLVNPWRGLRHLPHLRRPDLVYAWYPPLGTGQTAALLARGFACPLVLHIQDLFPDNALETGVLRPGPAAALAARAAGALYRRADLVVAHAPGTAARLTRLGIPATHLHNWVSHTMEPAAPAPTPAPPAPDAPLTILVAGVLGLAQGMEQLVDLAAALEAEPGVRFVVVGDGPRREWLTQQVAARKLPNIEVRPMVPAPEYAGLVRRCDLFLALLAPTIRYPVIPSKLADAMVAGRAIAALFPPGDACDMIRESGAGVVLPRNDPDRQAGALLALARDPASRHRMAAAGRRFANHHLNPDILLPRLHQLLRQTTRRPGPPSG